MPKVEVGQNIEIVDQENFVLNRGKVVLSSVHNGAQKIEVKTDHGKISLLYIPHYDSWKYCNENGEWSLDADCVNIRLV